MPHAQGQARGHAHRHRTKWITLDAFGTLFQYEHVLREAAKQVVDREHLTISSEVFYQKWKELSSAQAWDKQPYRKLAEWFQLSLADTFAFFGHKGHVIKGVNINLSLIHAVPLYQHALAFLDQVHGPYKICILSNIDNQDLQRVLYKQRLQFDGIMTSEMAEAYKPNCQIFEKALSFIETLPEHVVHIGDSPYHDVLGAKEAGMISWWLNRHNQPFPSEISQKPDAVFPSLLEVGKALIKD